MNQGKTARLSRAWLYALPLLGAVLMLPQARAQEAGAIERVNGTVSIANAANQSRPARSGEPLQTGETITTENGGEVLIKLKDDSLVTLRPNTQMKLAEYRYENKPTDGMLVNLFKGTMRAVSGLVGKTRPANVKFSTSTATVGIRGTDFEIAIIEQDDGNTRAGTYNYVNSGETNISIAAGPNVNVQPEQTGLALANPRPGEDPVQLLRERPAFLRGGGFDALMLNIVNPVPVMPRFR
jgi:hypothetical protein